MILFRNRVLKKFNFSDLPSKTGSEAVSAFGIGSRLVAGNVCGCGANRILDVEGRSFVCSLGARCCFGLFAGWLVESFEDSCHHVTTIYRCCFRVSRSVNFDGGRRSCYGDILWFRVRVLSIHVDSLFLV